MCSCANLAAPFPPPPYRPKIFFVTFLIFIKAIQALVRSFRVMVLVIAWHSWKGKCISVWVDEMFELQHLACFSCGTVGGKVFLRLCMLFLSHSCFRPLGPKVILRINHLFHLSSVHFVFCWHSVLVSPVSITVVSMPNWFHCSIIHGTRVQVRNVYTGATGGLNCPVRFCKMAHFRACQSMFHSLIMLVQE